MLELWGETPSASLSQLLTSPNQYCVQLVLCHSNRKQVVYNVRVYAFCNYYLVLMLWLAGKCWQLFIVCVDKVLLHFSPVCHQFMQVLLHFTYKGYLPVVGGHSDGMVGLYTLMVLTYSFSS